MWIGSIQRTSSGLLDRLDVEVDHDRLAAAAHQHAFQRLVGGGVDLLVRHVRRHVDEVARPGLGDEFQLLAPAHPRPALDHIDHAFQRAVMMRAGLGVGMDVTVPAQSFCAPTRAKLIAAARFMPGRLRGVGIELVARDHLDAVRLPIDRLRRSCCSFTSSSAPVRGPDLIMLIKWFTILDTEVFRYI